MLTGKQKQYLKKRGGQSSRLCADWEGRHDFCRGAECGGRSSGKGTGEGQINQNSDEDIRDTASILAEKLDCEIVQIIGRNCVLFKQKERNLIMSSPDKGCRAAIPRMKRIVVKVGTSS